MTPRWFAADEKAAGSTSAQSIPSDKCKTLVIELMKLPQDAT